MKTMRKEVAVKNKTGIYKQFYWCEASSTWKPTGRYRAVRAIQIGETSKKEQAFFANIADALKFRHDGQTDSISDDVMMGVEPNNGLLFRDLVEQWKRFHYLTIEESTRQGYEKLRPALDFLNDYPVKKIDQQVLNRLAYFWMNDYPRSFRRKTFKKEWQLLRVILQHYKDEIPEGSGYGMPSFRKLKKMTVLVPEVEGDVKYLDSEETIAFLGKLRERHYVFFQVALVQYFFALRIGEVCALYKDCIDFEKKIVAIRRGATWNLRTWVAKINEYTKNKRVRFLPIPDLLVTELRTAIASSDPKSPLLFSRPDGTPLNRKTIATFYNKVLGEIGFTHVSGTHFMRRTAATLANEATGDIDAISRFLGHSSVRVTRKYTGETDRQKLRVSNALGAVFQVDGAPDQMFGTSVFPQIPARRF